MRCPDLSVLSNLVSESFLALVRLADGVKRGVGLMCKPKDRLIVARWRVLVLGPTVFIMPDDLPPVCQPQFVHVGRQEAGVIVNRVHKEVARRPKDALRVS